MLGTLAKDQVERSGGEPVEFLKYGEEELDYLRSRDARLADVIDRAGMIYEYVDHDLYTALVRNIIGQQITIPLYEKTWAGFQALFGRTPEPAKVLESGIDSIRSLGIPIKRAQYILDISKGFIDGTIDQGKAESMSDEEAMDYLTSIRGVGPWTAEMVLLFCLRRKDVFSYGDIALLRGLRMLYGLEEIDKTTFEGFRRLFSPYCSIASIYIWEVGEGRIPGFTDPRKRKNSRK